MMRREFLELLNLTVSGANTGGPNYLKRMRYKLAAESYWPMDYSSLIRWEVST